MPIKEINAPAVHAPAVELSPTSGFWDTRLAPFLEKHFLLLTLCLVGIACVRIISTYNALSLTVDEPEHFACGLEYVAKHVYRFQTQHAPLSRAFQALGPYLAGTRPLGLATAAEESYWDIAELGNPDRTVFLMRLGNLPFFLLACLVVWGWSWHTYGKPIAVVATGLFTLLPTVLADAGLATPDMALAANVGAAFLAAILWAEQPTVFRSVLMGFFTALACLSRFTALGFLPAAAGMGLASHLAVCWPGWRGLARAALRRAAPLALAAATAALVIWAGYWFSVASPGSLVLGGWVGRNFSLPAPEFFDGIRKALHHNRAGHPGFLLGQFRMTGWWYYYPVALAVKTPIAFLILLALGAFVCWRERHRPFWLLPLAFSLGILLPALRSRIDIGIRHVEPIYIGFAIISALGLKQLLQGSRSGVINALAAGALLAWLVISGAVYHPDYLAYFNGFAGKTPENILVDSNYDWDQDTRILAHRLHELGVKEFSLTVWHSVKYYDYREAWYGLPKIREGFDFCAPLPGWTVVSPTFDKALKFNMYGPNNPPPACVMNPWYDHVAPTERAGTMLLYYVPSNASANSPHAADAGKAP